MPNVDSVIFKTDNEVVEKNNPGIPKRGEIPSFTPSPHRIKIYFCKIITSK